MKTTPNYGLKKPEASDYYDVDDFNHNADTLDAALAENRDLIQQHASQHSINGSDPITLAMIGAAGGINLADNCYFRAPLNQRGQTEYRVSGYCIDRWRLGGDEFALTVGDGVSMSHTNGKFSRLSQYCNNAAHFAGKTVTFSVMVNGPATFFVAVFINKAGTSTLGRFALTAEADSGVFSVTGKIPDNATTVDIVIGFQTANPTGVLTIHAAKLELGSVQTLARQEADGQWVLNDPPPDKGMELLKCIQSTADPSDTYANKMILHTGTVTAGTTDITAGTTALGTGCQYLVYE